MFQELLNSIKEALGPARDEQSNSHAEIQNSLWELWDEIGHDIVASFEDEEERAQSLLGAFDTTGGYKNLSDASKSIWQKLSYDEKTALAREVAQE